VTVQVPVVIKIGGAVLSQAGAFELVTTALSALGRGRRLVVVPGGGPFEGALRELLRRQRIGDDAAHWMAVLGMDQYAHALVDRTAGGALVLNPGEIDSALAAGRIPILAPYQWLRLTDPLPHAGDTTSDTVSAWIAGALGASRLVLIKPVRSEIPTVVDSHFAQALSPGTETVVLTPHELDKLGEALQEMLPPGTWRTALSS